MEIIEFENRYQPDFKRLNMEWLDAYNLTESHDLDILNNPVETVIKRGGYIFLVKEKENIIGTVGLWKENDDEYELIKMSVDLEYRRKGISKLLLDYCLQKMKKVQAKKIFLYSNSQLKTAIYLYEKYGFKYVPVSNAPFITADIKMELLLNDT